MDNHSLQLIQSSKAASRTGSVKINLSQLIHKNADKINWSRVSESSNGLVQKLSEHIKYEALE